MKKFITGILCFIGLSTQSFAGNLMWATGNAYLEQCSNLQSRFIEREKACLEVATNLRFAAYDLLIYFSEQAGIDYEKFWRHYQLDKVSAYTVHRIPLKIPPFLD